jgi:hypothetical protein
MIFSKILRAYHRIIGKNSKIINPKELKESTI